MQPEAICTIGYAGRGDRGRADVEHELDPGLPQRADKGRNASKPSGKPHRNPLSK